MSGNGADPFIAAGELSGGCLFGIFRYLLWPLLLISLFGPLGLIVWLFIH